MNYRKAVSEARQLVKRSEADQWRLAELTWRAVREGGITQTKWAQDVGVSQQYASRLVAMWSHYNDVVDRPRFSDAYAEAQGLSVSRDQRRLGEAMSNLQRASVVQRAEAAHRLLADPEVASLVTARETRAIGPLPSPQPDYADDRIRVRDVIREVPTPQERREERERTVNAAFEDAYETLVVLGDRLRRGGIDPVDNDTARRYDTYRDEMQSVLAAWDEAWALHKLEASF